MSWRDPRTAAVAAAAAALLALLVAAGRWEGARHIDAELRTMTATLGEIGPLDSERLSGYRTLPGFDCLVYREGENPYALEVCVDGAGRVIETVDRRRFERRIGTLRERPAASTLEVDRALVNRLLLRMGAV